MITIRIDSDKIRQLGSTAKHQQMTTPEAEAFLTLHGSQLVDHIEAVIKSFVKTKLT